jgi:hypothetical protein
MIGGVRFQSASVVTGLSFARQASLFDPKRTCIRQLDRDLWATLIGSHSGGTAGNVRGLAGSRSFIVTSKDIICARPVHDRSRSQSAFG